MQILKGIRIVAIAMAQNNFAGTWAHIFLDCIQCDQSIGLKYTNNKEADRVTNAEAMDIFGKEGWTIRPTLCPQCTAEQQGIPGEREAEAKAAAGQPAESALSQCVAPRAGLLPSGPASRPTGD